MAKSKSEKKNKKREPTLAEVIGADLVGSTTVIIDGVPRLRERDGLVESATAVRRLRVAVRAVEELLEMPAAARLEEDLSWYGGLLDKIVDLDHVSARVATLIAAQPAELVVGQVASQLETELQTSRQAVWGELATALDSPRIHQLLAALHRWRSDPPLLADADRPAKRLKALRKEAADRLERRRDTARAALAHDPYAADADTAAVLDRAVRARQRVEQLRALPGEAVPGDTGLDPLEEHRRSRLTTDLLRGEGIRVGVRSGHNGFSYGLLYAVERQHQRELASAV